METKVNFVKMVAYDKGSQSPPWIWFWTNTCIFHFNSDLKSHSSTIFLPKCPYKSKNAMISLISSRFLAALSAG